MKRSFTKTAGILLCFALPLISCLPNKNANNILCIQEFKLIATTVLNPDKVFFRITTDEKLRGLLLQKDWDSIKFSGGFFDTLNFNNKLIGVAEADKPGELMIGMATAKFFRYAANQKDSIAARTYEKVEINVFSKEKTWKLRPCDKSDIEKY